MFGFDQLSRLGVMAAVGVAQGRWHVLRMGPKLRMFTRATPDGATVVGALMGPAEDYEPGLLVIEKDGQTLTACYPVQRTLNLAACWLT